MSTTEQTGPGERECTCPPGGEELCEACEIDLWEAKTGKSWAEWKRSAISVDVGPGNGSLNANKEYTDSIAYQANDGRSHNRTTFHLDDVESNQYRRLHRHQEGVGEPGRSVDNRRAERKRFAQTASGNLELTPYQKERVSYIVTRLSYDLFGPHSTEAVAMGVISLVVDQDACHDPEDWDIEQWIVYRSDFKQLMGSVEMEMSDLWSIRRTLVTETEYFRDK